MRFSAVFLFFSFGSLLSGSSFSEQAILLSWVNAMRIAGCILMMGLMFTFPSTTADAAREAILVWGLDVIPSLFPYMVLSRMLAARLRRKGFPVSVAASTLGLIGGSPSGAAAISAFAGDNRLSSRSLYALCALTGTISPMFILNTAGPWLGDSSLTAALFFSHYTGALLCAMLVYLALSKEFRGMTRQQVITVENASADPVAISVNAALNIGGCIVFFSVISAGISALLPGSLSSASSVFHAALEIAGGLRKIADAGFSGFTLGIVAAACLGFSGISMLSQNLLFLKAFGVRMSHLAALGVLRAGCSAAVMACIWGLFH